MSKNKITAAVKFFLLFYIIIGLGLYFAQDYLFFQAVPLDRNHRYGFSQPHQEILIPYSGHSSIHIIQFPSQSDSNKGVVLYFHGNKKNIGWYARYAPYFTKEGYAVWMIDYPGYGKSTGTLSEELLYDWALQLYKLARTRYSPAQIIIYGKSLGTGIAAQLASVRDCRRLILETPYYDFPSVLRPYFFLYPLNQMIHYQFPTHQYLPLVTAPVTLLHGTSDWIVRYSNSEKLKKENEQMIELVTVPGGSHNDLFDYPAIKKKIDSLLE
jgi:alpha-beta hydrolase superfamily lysophospholipase